MTAPEGSDVRILLALMGGSMAYFKLAPGKISRAVAHHQGQKSSSFHRMWDIAAGWAFGWTCC